jgi:uncharacterized phiE125 gp8 family phage protein
MMLIEQTSVPTAAVPIIEFKDHLRLGTGFADDGTQDAILEAYLRAAMSAIEGRTGKILITRQFVWTLTAWRCEGFQSLPVAPVPVLSAIKLIDALGAETTLDTSRYRLIQDNQRPRIEATGGYLPPVPHGGSAEIQFDAGFGGSWSDIPAAMQQAILLLAAVFYENRSEPNFPESNLPMAVATLIEPYRTVRLLGGGAS